MEFLVARDGEGSPELLCLTGTRLSKHGSQLAHLRLARLRERGLHISHLRITGFRHRLRGRGDDGVDAQAVAG